MKTPLMTLSLTAGIALAGLAMNLSFTTSASAASVDASDLNSWRARYGTSPAAVASDAMRLTGMQK